MERKTLSTIDAAEYLGISISWLYQLVRDNLIPFHKKPGKPPRGGNLWFKVAELDAWKDSGEGNVEKDQ